MFFGSKVVLFQSSFGHDSLNHILTSGLKCFVKKHEVYTTEN